MSRRPGKRSSRMGGCTPVTLPRWTRMVVCSSSIARMILTAGFNVYPAELERVIAGHPDVALVAVGTIADEEKGELAKAYIVPKAGSTPQADNIIAFCREHLAAYKVPRAVQFVNDLPKTSTGKVMRRELHTLNA